MQSKNPYGSNNLDITRLRKPLAGMHLWADAACKSLALGASHLDDDWLAIHKVRDSVEAAIEHFFGEGDAELVTAYAEFINHAHEAV